MPELIQTYWPYFLIAFAIGLAVAWFAFMANRRTSVVSERKDVLDEGAERARRNQALIDAPGGTVTPATNPASQGSLTGGDELTRIKGLGPKIAAKLGEMGVTRFEQIAAWDDAEIDRIDAKLDRFQGRIRRDNWVAQAKLLAAGDEAGFVSEFGREG